MVFPVPETKNLVGLLNELKHAKNGDALALFLSAYGVSYNGDMHWAIEVLNDPTKYDDSDVRGKAVVALNYMEPVFNEILDVCRPVIGDRRAPRASRHQAGLMQTTVVYMRGSLHKIIDSHTK